MAQEPLITVDYVELDSPTEEFSPGFKSTRILQCDFDDRIKLAQQLLGITNESEGQSSRTMPARHPDFAKARVSTVQISPFAKQDMSGIPDPISINGTRAHYPKGHLTVNYTVQTGNSLDADSQHKVDDRFDGNIQFLNLAIKGAQLFWSDGTRVNTDSAPGVQIRGIVWTRAVQWVTTVPEDFFALQGHVNDATFKISDIKTAPEGIGSATVPFEFPEECLLYQNGTANQQFDIDGNLKWLLTMTFNLVTNPNNADFGNLTAGWNKFFQPGNPQANNIFTDKASTTEYLPYPSTDLLSFINNKILN